MKAHHALYKVCARRDNSKHHAKLWFIIQRFIWATATNKMCINKKRKKEKGHELFRSPFLWLVKTISSWEILMAHSSVRKRNLRVSLEEENK